MALTMNLSDLISNRKQLSKALCKASDEVIPSIVDCFTPLGSLIKGGYKAYKSISDYLFYKRINSFLNPTQEVSDDSIRTFLDGLGEDYERVSDYLLTILSTAESCEKAFAIGIIFESAVTKRIDTNMMLRLTSIINRSFISDLKLLPNYIEDNDAYCMELNSFISLGLIDNYNGGIWKGQPTCKLNAVGLKLYEILNSKGWFAKQ